MINKQNIFYSVFTCVFFYLLHHSLNLTFLTLSSTLWWASYIVCLCLDCYS